MVNVITQLFKYVTALLIAIYVIKCFTVFHAKTEKKKRKNYRRQNTTMLIIHFMMNAIIFMNTQDPKMIVFYAAQVVFFAMTLVVYGNVYKNGSTLLINNMLMLLMIGFVILTRLDFSLAVKQFFIAFASVVISIFIPVIIEKLHFLSKISMVYGILGILIISSVFVFGQKVYGATNWISIAGIGFQPSELAKIVFVFFIAAMLCRDTSFKCIAITTVLAAVHVLLLVKETDLGAAVIFFFTYLMMLYVATRKLRYTLLGLAAGSGAAVVAYKLFDHVKRRVVAWQDPWSNYNDAGYQIAQSLFAIGTGGWFGMGLYQGLPSAIPVNQSDFIFSIIVEELGAFFAICIILIYISCFIMFINISLKLTENFYKLLAIGLSVSYAFQIFLCIGGVIKFIPHTGVTMPLISYGGSSILSTIIVFAVIQGLYLLKQKEVRQLGEE